MLKLIVHYLVFTEINVRSHWVWYRGGLILQWRTSSTRVIDSSVKRPIKRYKRKGKKRKEKKRKEKKRKEKKGKKRKEKIRKEKKYRLH